MWRRLFTQQMAALRGRAYPGFFENVATLGLTADRIPDLEAVSDIIEPRTGWRIQGVDGLVEERTFFELLARQRFPSTPFVRPPADLELTVEPDIFHEVFGHATLLLDADHARNFQRFGELGVACDAIERPLLSRLFWYIYEGGQIATDDGVRVLGGGSMSCHEEVEWLFSGGPALVPLDVMDALRSPYPFDRMHYKYYVVRDAAHVAAVLADGDGLRRTLRAAHAAGEFTPWFPLIRNNHHGAGKCAFTLPGPLPA